MVHIEAAGEAVPGRRCGVTYVTPSAFYIFYDPLTSHAHQDHVIGHEIAHLLLGHHERRQLSEEVPQGLAPLLDPALVEMMLGRSSYEEAEEHDAELLASYLSGRVIEHRLRSASPTGDDIQERIAHTLLSRRGADR
ncbi:secondary metabolite protein [Streptomyces caniscabiei]|uniref:secondary metabolite protein n=1 Tax=Streptomyces caniscabiei TaxID=2746961 RepID=UPI0038F68AD4